MQNNIPKFRLDLAVIPMSYQGQQGVMIRDSLGIIKETVFVQGAGLMVLGLMDGRRSVKDIQLELIRQEQGSFVSLDWVNKVVLEFQAAFLLESEEYHKKKDQVILDYLAESTRKAALQGKPILLLLKSLIHIWIPFLIFPAQNKMRRFPKQRFWWHLISTSTPAVTCMLPLIGRDAD